MSSSLIQELLQGLCQFHFISRQIQGSMDGLSLSPGVEALLRPTQFSHIQPKVLPPKVFFFLPSSPTIITNFYPPNFFFQNPFKPSLWGDRVEYKEELLSQENEAEGLVDAPRSKSAKNYRLDVAK